MVSLMDLLNFTDYNGDCLTEKMPAISYVI